MPRCRPTTSRTSRDVTALLAGIGIGGVAIALAVQSVLGDLFACGLRGAVESIGLKTTRVRFDRARFKEHGDWALAFEVVYYVRSPDYNQYMDVQQGLNLATHERFAAESVDFAFPTRTLFVREERAAPPGASVRAPRETRVPAPG